MSGGNNVTLPDGVELHRVLLGLTDHLRDHRQVRHLHGGPAELEDDDEEGVVGEPGRHTTVRRAQEAVDQQQRERYRHCYRTWNVNNNNNNNNNNKFYSTEINTFCFVFSTVGDR